MTITDRVQRICRQGFAIAHGVDYTQDALTLVLLHTSFTCNNCNRVA
jgi:hypothetical protein